MAYESERLYVKKGTHRTAEVKTNPLGENEYIVYFYYDNARDYEWKKGAAGLPCDICKTMEQAKRKANNYVKKDNQ